MFDWILRQQKKSKEQRRRMALVISLSSMFILVAVWLTVLFSGSGEGIGQLTTEDVAGPFESIGSSLSSAIDSIEELFEGFTTVY
ncbi:MAG TPA: hypothetical protein QGH03_01935 [Candidatus Paceibacterota bacterium]|jgi:hypothetical protein|nr:hypothetical protein [Parcubacteria group bacterium]HJN62971.1 hypothetical protein [Candidatus Paceibacterota bacterium]|tara:strand:- start:540 stop:794 length:255 start_codon:yes stop_codon:yes gene_type:complete